MGQAHPAPSDCLKSHSIASVQRIGIKLYKKYKKIKR